MWYRVVGLLFTVSTSSWIRLARVLKNFIDMITISSILYYYDHYLIYIIILLMIKNSHVCYQQYDFFLNDIFLTYIQIHIPQIYQIYKIRAKIWAYTFKLYVTTCFYIWCWIILSMFLITYLDYIYIYIVCGNCLLTLNMVMCCNAL